MKSSIIITLLLFVFSATAQTVAISGDVKDTASQSVPFADVLLLSVKDSVTIKSTLANEEGRFEIKGIEKGDYILKVSSLGFSNYAVAVNLQDNFSTNVTLQESTQVLEAVEITSKRPIVRRKIDRLEFDVENSTLSSDNAWEILKKTPGVS
ncbi:MAG: carboxypeptidase-like regulatory domain-containing protein, partial [Flavobacterium sp.]